MSLFTRDKIYIAADKSAFIEYDRGTDDVFVVANGIKKWLVGANPVVALAATALTVTPDAHNGRLISLNHTGAASTVTLPAATGSGAKYRFVVGAVNTSNHVIKVANATDVFEGLALMAQDAADTMLAFESAAASDTITLNGTTTGGAAIGDYIEIEDYASGKFRVLAHLTGTGSEATPFSATVS